MSIKTKTTLFYGKNKTDKSLDVGELFLFIHDNFDWLIVEVSSVFILSAYESMLK